MIELRFRVAVFSDSVLNIIFSGGNNNLTMPLAESFLQINTSPGTCWPTGLTDVMK